MVIMNRQKKSPQVMKNSHEIRRRKTLAAEKVEFTCEICTETTSKDNQFNNNSRCKHPFCVDCIAKYAQVKIEDDQTAKIQCPGLDCKQLLDPLSCGRMIQPSVFSQWCDLLFENYLLGCDKSFCPNRDCMGVVVNECRRRKVKKAQCPNCKKRFCFQCKVEWHDGYQCNERDWLRDPNDIQFEKLAKTKNWATCPGCGRCVERKGGCPHMTCRCKTRFCYKCGRKLPCWCDPMSEVVFIHDQRIYLYGSMFILIILILYAYFNIS